MRFALQTLAGFVFAFALALPACGGAPKQAEVPDVEKDTGADMTGGEDPRDGGELAKKEAAAPEEDMHAKCCGLCKEAVAKDRSGASPTTVPCADFSDLTPWCLEHFRSKPTMASECK